MINHRIRAREARGEQRAPARLTAPDDVAVYLQDAAHTPGGHTPAVVLPRTEAEVAHVLREHASVLPIGAQSSLTGGATPFGDVVLSLSRMVAVGAIAKDRVRVQSGVALVTLEDELRKQGLFYPPTPTFRGAFVGGTVATNAAGAATFKYGSTRAWVRALTVVLARGDVLDLERGECQASSDGWFDVVLTSGETRRIPLPTYTMPNVPKCSAGYHVEPEMDLVDLFLGSEGTLGVITEVEVGLIPEPARLLGWATFESEAAALVAVAALREASRATWAARDACGIDVASIESMDRRCLDLLREERLDRRLGASLGPEADTAVLFLAELSPGTDRASAMEQLSGADDPGARDGSLTRLVRLLRDHGVLDSLEVALPGDRARAEQLQALREGVPVAVNHRIGDVKRGGHPGVRKTAGDMIVPFRELGTMMSRYRESFARRGLDHALWGHVSDGNIHANVIPRSEDDVARGDEALLELGEEAIRLGGCPLSEHGVGRNAVKQELLRRLYGDRGIDQMRRVKAALDPEWKLSPGVLFPRRPRATGSSR
jgi:D-lactate dehydrogenase (cytochrome)